MAIWPSMSMTPGQAASVRAQTARPARRVIAGTQSSSRPAWPSSRWVIGEPARSCFPSLRMRVRHPAGWQGRNPSVASTPSFEMAKGRSAASTPSFVAAKPHFRMRVRHPAGWQGRNPSVASTSSFEMAGRSAACTPSIVAAKPHITDASTSSTLTARPHRPLASTSFARMARPHWGCLGKTALTTP
jgi:hypothetical protein